MAVASETDVSENALQQPALQVLRSADRVFSFLMGFSAVFAVVANAQYVDSFHSARLAPVLVGLLCLHLVRYRKFAFFPELGLYLTFFVYMLVQLFWTNDQGLALNTIFPAFNFVIILVLFAALLRLHWTKTVLTGMFFGFVFSAILYFVQTGFPLRFPADFSYNSIALVYLFGLYIVFQLASIAESKLLLIGVGAVILIHILATTSIKTNLGLLIGLAAAGVVYSRYFGQFLRKYMVVVVLALAVMGVGVASNDSLYQSVNRGASRIAIGVELLQARGDLPGYSAADERWNWQRVGIEGWSESPLFGNGVESFRSRVGITSHSTPIDLLYNSGLVGFMLFYSVLASLAMRVLGKKAAGSLQVRATVLVFGITFLFITLFGTMHYSAFLAAFIAMSAALLGGGQKIAADTVQSEAADK